ncbi:MAG TPA: LytTR family DNA-binding domain-containing protein [Saprospiraceae bacterium]|nr:LytTR family DNA-binding domain-containing protein [Saprospiraceae bacterium]HMU02800.1 LytTR family DNA-binding domain-containing protein [Saprospiraceae bacterium]
MIKAIALDDEFPALRVLQNFCQRHQGIELIESFTIPDDAKNYIETNDVDLIFLDIQMPNISGVQFFKTLQKNIHVIFTTAHADFAVEGFNLSAIDYLLKPFTYDRFSEAIQKSILQLQYKKSSQAASLDGIAVKVDSVITKVNFDTIELIEGYDEYIKIHLTHQKILIVRLTMANILKELPSDKFLRVHKSYIVNVLKIQKRVQNTLVLENKTIPIGRKYSQAVSSLLNPIINANKP